VVPSVLVSPPAVSSRQEVKTTGEVSVPWASRDPSTYSSLFGENFTITPAGTVNVVPDGTVTVQVTR